MKIKVNLSIEEKIWKEYRKLCIDKDKIPSYEIEKFIKMEAKRNGKR